MTAASRSLRLAAVAVFCGLPLLLFAFAADALVEAMTSRRVAAEQTATAAQIVREIAGRQLRHPAPRDTAALYLAAPSTSLARAELQERVVHLVEAAGGHLQETQFVDAPERESAGAIAVEVGFTIDNEGLRDALYAIETATPLLDITALTARPAADAHTAARLAPKPLLHIDLTVEAHTREGTG